jgi:hypothetical protein
MRLLSCRTVGDTATSKDCIGRAMAQTVGLQPPTRTPGFAPWSIHVGFVVDKVALEQVFLRVLRFSSVSVIIPPGLHTHISYIVI